MNIFVGEEKESAHFPVYNGSYEVGSCAIGQFVGMNEDVSRLQVIMAKYNTILEVLKVAGGNYDRIHVVVFGMDGDIAGGRV